MSQTKSPTKQKEEVKGTPTPESPKTMEEAMAEIERLKTANAEKDEEILELNDAVRTKDIEKETNFLIATYEGQKYELRFISYQGKNARTQAMERIRAQQVKDDPELYLPDLLDKKSSLIHLLKPNASEKGGEV